MDGRFDPTKYETVKQRKDRIAADYPRHVILAVPREVTSEQASFTVGLWREREKMEVGADRLARAIEGGAVVSPEVALLLMAPDSLGTAYEAKWMGMASKTSWTENCEESAIGRCLDNAGYHGGGKCSREEILKAKEAETVLATMPKQPLPEAPLPKTPLDNPFVEPVDLSQFDRQPNTRAFLEQWHHRKGVNDWRACFTRAYGALGWDEERLWAWALEKGVNLSNSPKAEDAMKLNVLLLREPAKAAQS